MTKLDDPVSIPQVINTGLSYCREQTMLHTFGSPGQLSKQCGPCTGTVKARMRYGVSVGPFKVSGMDYAVDSLIQIFAALNQQHPDVFQAVKSAGMLCVRAKHVNPKSFSNHSWGTAIDLYFGDHVVDQGVHKTQLGFLYLAGLFQAHGWYWGAGFSGNSVDSMHFELAEETIPKIPGSSPDNTGLIAANEYIAKTGYDTVIEDA